MDLLQSLAFFGLITSFFFGQLSRLNLGFINFPVFDIFLVLFALLNGYINRKNIRNRYFLLFIVYAWVNLAINALLRHLAIFSPAAYLLRLTSLLSLFIFTPKKPLKFRSYFTLVLIATVIFGLLQYFLWPDLTYLKAVGWDDHLNRLVSTFFDPTFTGLIFLLFLFWLLFQRRKLWWLIIPTYIAMALTYSRSTLLSLLVGAMAVSIYLKQSKFILIALGVVILTIFALPRLPGEGTKLERTSSVNAKFINYRQALYQYSQAPLFGVGYNNLVYVIPKSEKNLHSYSGFDSSLLTILTTTGAVGFGLFALGIFLLYSQFDALGKTLLVTILIHSLFANSLLYPWTLVCLFLLATYRK